MVFGTASGHLLPTKSHSPLPLEENFSVSWPTVFAIAVGPGMDAFAVGLSMAFWGVAVWTPSVIIGGVAMGMTALGMVLGRTLGSRFGNYAGLLGGMILIGIGIKIVLEYMASG